MPDYLGPTGAIDETWIRSHSRILYRHRLPAAAVLATAVLAAVVYVFAATPIFEGRTQLLIQVQTPEAIKFREEPDDTQLTTDDYQTQYGVLRSRTLARRTIDTLKLWDHPEFRADTSRTNGGSGGGTAAPAAAAEETAQQTAVINGFLKKLSIEPVTNSRLVDVAFQAADPKLAAQVANTLSQTYIDQNVEGRFETSRAAAEWLEAQLSQQRGRLEQGQQSLQRYREKNPGAGADNTTNIVAHKLADLNAAVTRAETQRIEKQAAFERLSSIQNDQLALDTFPAVLASPFIQALKTELAGLEAQRQEMSQRLGERHPDMVKLNPAIESAQARLQSEIGKIVQSVENEYLAAQSNEQRLLAELAAQQGKAVAQDRRAVDFGVIQREVTTNQQLFDSLMQRAKELGIQGDFRSTNVRIVDQAEVPSRPIRPARLQALLLALLVGTTLAFGTAVSLERLDPRIKSPVEIPAYLGLPYLGLVPEVPPADVATGRPPLGKSAPPALVNAFKDLSTTLIIKSDPAAPRIVMVCSAGPGDGKTLVASNLACALATTGHRVVLVDVDMHRPRVHEVFGIAKATGLTDVLAGKATHDQTVRPSSTERLWLMSAGQPPDHAVAFLGSGTQFGDLLTALAKEFDWVVIDSPPVLAVADSTLIARDVMGVVFVVSTQKTTREAARAAIERLDNAGARFYGALLNRADTTRHAYYFDPYYRHEYGAYYGRDAQGTVSPMRATVPRRDKAAPAPALHGNLKGNGNEKSAGTVTPTGNGDGNRPSASGGQRRAAPKSPSLTGRSQPADRN